MRAHLIVSALFATSLFCGAAMADRPGEDGGRTARMPVIREPRVREVREPQQREARPHETPQTRVREPQVVERLRARGDMVDQGGSRGSAAQAKATAGTDAAGAKAQRNAEKMQRQLNAKKDALINCAPSDDSCGPSARAAAAAAQAAQKAESAKQRAEVQKMVEKARADKLREIIHKKICEKHANMCDSNL